MTLGNKAIMALIEAFRAAGLHVNDIHCELTPIDPFNQRAVVMLEGGEQIMVIIPWHLNERHKAMQEIYDAVLIQYNKTHPKKIEQQGGPSYY